MDNKYKQKIPKRWTEEEELERLNILQNNLIYKCISGFLEASIIDEGSKLIRLLREDKPDKECLAAIRNVRGKVVVYDGILGYIEAWRHKALKLQQEEKDGKKEKR